MFDFEIKDPNKDNIQILNKEFLWVPFNKSYEKWLIDLCVTLIKSGFLNDEICVLCVEIFEKKVYFNFIISKC